MPIGNPSQCNVAMQVTRPGGQLWKQCKWRHLMTKCWTNASCATWWPNLQLMQVAPPVEQICNHCKYLHVVANIWKQWTRLHMAKLSSCKWQVAPSSGLAVALSWFIEPDSAKKSLLWFKLCNQRSLALSSSAIFANGNTLSWSCLN